MPQVSWQDLLCGCGAGDDERTVLPANGATSKETGW